jgi:very-short-patch-repair endonuclease
VRFLHDDDPRFIAWQMTESPIEQCLCCGLFVLLGCSAVLGRYELHRRAELAVLAGEKPAAFVFPQHEVGRYRVDFLLVLIDPAARRSRTFALECDGQDFHSSDEQLACDAGRDAALRAAGCHDVVRFSGGLLNQNFPAVMGSISALLEAFGVEIEVPSDCEGYAWLLSRFCRTDAADQRLRKIERERITRELDEEERVTRALCCEQTGTWDDDEIAA